MIVDVIHMRIDGAAAVTCESLGWSFVSLVKKSLDSDVVTLRRKSSPASATAIPDSAKVSFWVGETRIFEGVAQAPAVGLADGVAVITQRILGPWWYLTQVTFCRGLYLTVENFRGHPPAVGDTFTYVVPEGGAYRTEWDAVTQTWVPIEASTTYYEFGRQSLIAGRGDSAANPIIADIAAWVGSRGVLFDPIIDGFSVQYRTLYYTLEELKGAFSATYEGVDGLAPVLEFGYGIINLDEVGSRAPKIRTFSDRKISDLIAEALAVAPEVCSWVDYAKEGLPAIHWDASSGMLESAAPLLLSDPELVSADIVPRPELQVAGVVLRWEQPHFNSAPGLRGIKQLVRIDKWPATILPHEPGVITHTLDWSIEAYRPSLAQKLYESFSIRRATGSLEFIPSTLESLTAIRPGVSFFVDSPLVGGSQLVVQETTWTPFNGRLSCVVGLPKRLDLRTMADLRGWVQITFGGWGWSQTNIVTA